MRELMIPATVNVPPTMAQTVVRKWYMGGRVSWYFTVIGFKSYLKTIWNIHITRGPWAAKPALIKVMAKRQI